MKRLIAAVLTAVLLSPLATHGASAQTPAQRLMSKLQWRSIGPYIGGRVVAIAGVPSDQNLFYMGGVEGGIWKSTNYGQSWTNISDGKLPGVADPIGALAVAPSDPRVIYAGTGEADIRGDFDTGDGIYKSSDAGKTWKYAGLRETHMTTALAIDPRDPNVVYASSMGHVFKPNAERGVFKTTDGGKTWRKVLFVDANTGGVQVVMDPRNASVLYAAMWQAQRVPWKLTSGGAGSGLYKTTDGGAHWTKISKHAGFANGTLGKIGVSVAASNPRIVYAIVQAHDGGVFRSTDAGASWKRVNSEMKLRQRAFYYMAIFADPTNPQVAYAPQVDGVYKTTNGGKTWKTITPPGDHHIIWINPHNPKILLEGNDGGATVSTDGGKTWSSENNQPTGQYYHVALDSQFPFHVYGAAQDEGAFEGPSATANGSIGLGEWHTVALGESTFVAPETGDPNVTYGSGYYSSFARLDDGVGQLHNVSPWPRYMAGASAAETKYRFGWTHPIFFSPANPSELLVAAQNVFSSTDHGQTWKILSPDLTRNDKSTEGPSGGPVDLDQTGAETFPDISSLAVSPRNGDIMWAGSADGLVHVTKDHGVHWTLVTPPALPQWAQISSIEPSHTSESTAYLTASRYQWDDFHPYVYKTTDYGAHWSAMTTGLPEDQYAFVVREDPREPRLLFAGTRSTAYVSLDGGARWQPLSLNLPGVQVRDLAIDPRQGELVAATHGRAFWILDNLALLEQLARQSKYSVTDAQLFAPETAWLSHAYGSGSFPIPDVGRNPRYGATVFFNVPADYDGKTPLELAFLDANGATIRSFALHLKDKHAKKVPPEVREQLDATHQRALDLQETTAIEPGMNAFQWNMRYAPAMDVPGFRTVGTDDFPDTSDGPTIAPGTYTVVLQYGANKLTQPLHVQLDPRLHPAAGDLDARLALEMQIHKTLDDLDKAIAAAMAARNRLPAGKREQVDREIDNLVQLNIHSSEADVLHETKLREQIGFLGNSLEAAYERPTAAEYATYDDLRAEAAAGEARLHAIESP
ncbi:MAG: WD40/YVTN/BNR-like repeat-containing protein [Vulcanimicrobiaceae bacterium]